MSEVEVEAKVEEPVPAPRNRRRVAIFGGVLVAAAVTGLFAFGATRYADTRGKLADIGAARSVAGDFGAATLTYDYRDLKPFERGMEAHATGTFKRQLTGGGLSALEALIKQLKSTSEATVKQVYVSEIGDHSVSALVVVEARAKNGDAPARTLDAAYIELQLVKVSGGWLIDGVSTLDLGQAASAPSVPGAPTATSVPPK